MLSPDDLAKEYLSLAEAFFGPASSKWLFLGVDFNSAPPHLEYFPERGGIVISLSEKALHDELQLRFQLAHETCHMLYPTMDFDTLEMESATVLNEGLSTFFSIITNEKYFDAEDVMRDLESNSRNYYGALKLVIELMSVDVNAIKKLRAIEPQLNKLDASHFGLAGIGISKHFVEQLLGQFE